MDTTIRTRFWYALFSMICSGHVLNIIGTYYLIEDLSLTGKELIKKWKGLRDNFMKEQRLMKRTELRGPAAKKKKKKKYVYFDQLSFLLPFAKGNDTLASYVPTPEEVIANSCDQVGQIREPHLENDSVRNKNVSSIKGELKERRRDNLFQGTSRAVTSIMAESRQLHREDGNSDKYGNKGFMLSFLPIMDSLPLHLQMHTRMQITEVFNSISFNMQSGSPCTSTFNCSSPSPEPPESLQSETLVTCEMDTKCEEDISIANHSIKIEK